MGVVQEEEEEAMVAALVGDDIKSLKVRIFSLFFLHL